MPDPIRPFLASLDRQALVELIAAEADRDDALAERLRLLAAKAAPSAEGLPALKKAINRVTRSYGFLSYRDRMSRSAWPSTPLPDSRRRSITPTTRMA